MTKAPIKQIVKRDGHMVSYDRDRITTAIFKAATSVGGSDRKTAEGLSEQVEHMLVDTYGHESAPSVEDIQDCVEKVLIDNGHATTARAYIIYRHEREELRTARAARIDATDNIPYQKIYEVLRWNLAHGCDSIEGINRIIKENRLSKLIASCDKRYSDEVLFGANCIMERLPEVRIAIIAGPSSSSKTTTTIKVSEKLKEADVEFKAINLDHYFFDLEMHPKDEFGDYDYETPQALDLKLINQHLYELLEGKTIKTPHYDFKTGTRQLDVHEMKLEKNQILLIDSLHGLYDAMTESIPASKKFKLYIETLGQVRNSHGEFMRWADNRLLRRMIRDSWHRNLQPLETLTHWHYVRRSEMQHIVPFIKNVDYLVNSALPYELPILKARLFKYLPEAMELYQGNAKRQDAYIRAKRIYDFMNEMTEQKDDTCVPSKSLLREFIGGSDYEY